MSTFRALTLLLIALAFASCTPEARPRPSADPIASPTQGTEVSPDQPAPSLAQGQYAQVVDVVDGDTIRVEYGGQTYRLRYIGIDAPELAHDGAQAEWMASEARAMNELLVSGRNVFLEKDVSETDRFGRILRYVWVDDVMVNAELVRRGYAHAVSFPPDVKYLDWLRQLQREAEENSLGMWAPRP